MNYNFVMKQKYKDMLKGAAIAQAMSSSESSDSTSNSKTNLKYGIGSKFGLPDSFWGVLMGIWILIVSLWVMVVGLILLFELAMYGSINILGLSLEGARMYIIAIVLGGLSWYIYYKIVVYFTSLFFWVTFLPFFIYFLIWFFAPSVNVTSYMPNMFWFL